VLVLTLLLHELVLSDANGAAENLLRCEVAYDEWVVDLPPVA
jgi:hypothetical protein